MDPSLLNYAGPSKYASSYNTSSHLPDPQASTSSPSSSANTQQQQQQQRFNSQQQNLPSSRQSQIGLQNQYPPSIPSGSISHQHQHSQQSQQSQQQQQQQNWSSSPSSPDSRIETNHNGHGTSSGMQYPNSHSNGHTHGNGNGNIGGGSQAAIGPLVEPHQDLNEFLESFWNKQMDIVEREEQDGKVNVSLPLARIKKVMKSDEDVKMISAEVPIMFSKACEVFISELTCRAWLVAESHKRRTLQKTDVAAAIAHSDMFDFLIDIVPRDGEEGGDTDGGVEVGGVGGGVGVGNGVAGSGGVGEGGGGESKAQSVVDDEAENEGEGEGEGDEGEGEGEVEGEGDGDGDGDEGEDLYKEFVEGDE